MCHRVSEADSKKALKIWVGKLLWFTQICTYITYIYIYVYQYLLGIVPLPAVEHGKWPAKFWIPCILKMWHNPNGDSVTAWRSIPIDILCTNDPCFDWKRPSFGGLKPANTGQTGSMYIYIYLFTYTHIHKNRMGNWVG